ncbi:hypothetical protein RND81_09G179500 [Saponaria officinalis]|uniref:Uncharacterized protein n=1 Tax=Saponaria officinalis TaxID=3572 RepID=A0AAW1IMV1_SAPOF
MVFNKIEICIEMVKLGLELAGVMAQAVKKVMHRNLTPTEEQLAASVAECNLYNYQVPFPYPGL